MQDTTNTVVPPSDMAGSWRLSKLGSDYLPGIDKLQGCPMVLKMKGESANTSEVSVILLLPKSFLIDLFNLTASRL